MKSLLKSCPSAIRTKLPKMTGHNACNPSVVVKNGKILCVYKGINYDLKKQGYKKSYAGFNVPFSDCQNYIAELTYDFHIDKIGFLEDRHIRARPLAYSGIQDLRIFEWRNEIYALGAAKNQKIDKENNNKISTKDTMCLCKIKGTYLEFVSFLPSRQKSEKNWMPWVHDDQLNFIYKSDPFEIIKFDNEWNEFEFKNTKMIKELESQYGGSCIIPYKNNYIGISHKKNTGSVIETDQSSSLMSYTHSFFIYNDRFEVIAASEEFTFESERIEFCCGLALIEDQILLSYGVWDAEAILLKLPITEFFEFVGLSSHL